MDRQAMGENLDVISKSARGAQPLRKSGFTLVEVMVSIFIFALLMLMFSGAMSVSSRAGRLSGQYAQATSLCQHKIDQMKAVGFGRLNYLELSDAGIIDGTPTAQPFSFLQVDDVESFLPQASTEITIQVINASVYRVTVGISWKNATHDSKVSSTSISALIANTE